MQGFCRVAAVNGSVYILGRRVANIQSCDPSSQTSTSTSRHTIELDDFPEPLHASYVLSSPAHVPEHLRHHVTPICFESPGSHPHVRAVARAIAVLDGILSPPREDESVQMEVGSDSLLILFPPGSVEGGSANGVVHVLTAGPDTMCTPPGKSMGPFFYQELSDQPFFQVSCICPCPCSAKRRKDPRISLNHILTKYYAQERLLTSLSSKCFILSRLLQQRSIASRTLPETTHFQSSLRYLPTWHTTLTVRRRSQRLHFTRYYHHYGLILPLISAMDSGLIPVRLSGTRSSVFSCL